MEDDGSTCRTQKPTLVSRGRPKADGIQPGGNDSTASTNLLSSELGLLDQSRYHRRELNFN